MKGEMTCVDRPRQAARDAYNRMSRWYDAMARPERRFVDMGVRLLASQEGERVLEIGCGTGHALASIARVAGVSGLAVGVDIAEGMLAATRARLRRAGLGRRLPLVMADAVALPFANGVFDAAFMAFTLELFDMPDISAVLSECTRVLRPGGRLGVVSLSRESGGRMVRLYEWAHRRWPRWIDCRPIYAQQVLEGAGFAVRRAICDAMWGLPVEIVVAARA